MTTLTFISPDTANPIRIEIDGDDFTISDPACTMPPHVRFQVAMMLIRSTGCVEPEVALLAGMVRERNSQVQSA